MGAAPKPIDEAARIAALLRYRILDTAPDPAFDRLTAIVSRVMEVPIALVSLVDAERQWFKSCIGLGDSKETSRDIAFCAYAIHGDSVFVIPDATADARFADNPVVVGEPYVRAYAGAPLRTSDGFRIGTLCAIDRRPRAFSPDQLATLMDLAHVVVSEMEQLRLMRSLRRAEEQIAERVSVLEAILESAGEGILVSDQHGRTLVANPMARRVTGRGVGGGGDADGRLLPLPPGFARDHGIFCADRATVFPVDELPLGKALRGEPTDQIAMHIRNASYPDGIDLQCTGRPIRDAAGAIRGGVVMINDVTALRIAQQRLGELAVTDELTGLPNRRALRDRLELLAAEAVRGRRFTVTIVDLDHFKRVNDTPGHAVGDQVLVAVAQALREGIRRSDLAARMGGEEFCVVQTDVDASRIAMLTERLRAAIAAIREPIPVTASLGVCHSAVACNPEAILATADAALYRAKAAGRNCVVIADDAHWVQRRPSTNGRPGSP
ncbi:MAG TPA: diguanylate cyclase [Kofleriaceae bacterium]